jgi:hypothetical protein
LLFLREQDFIDSNVIDNAHDQAMMKELPQDILDMLEQNNAPVLLHRHLTLVYNTSVRILDKSALAWPSLQVIKKEVLFGAATHDIGKMFETEELRQAGNRHEVVGYDFLIGNGIPENLARFAKTHGDWMDEGLRIEDLLVALADKIWKGKRIDELEERLTKKIADSLYADYWDVYTKLDEIISDIVIGADKRIRWQDSTG